MSLSSITHGRGPLVVVLPGLGLSARFTAAVTEPAIVDGNSVRRTYVSLPGTGSATNCEPSSDAILDVLTDWVETESGGEPFSLIGYSYGGYLAAALAQRLRTQVGRLLLVCSGVKLEPSERDLSGVQPPDTEPGWLGNCPEFLHEHLTIAVGRQYREVGDRLATALIEEPPADDAFLTELQARYQLTEEQPFTALDLPVTFVAGRRDQIAGYRDQLAACLDCPRGDYMLIGSAGHYLPAEVPAQFRDLVTSWLRR